MLWLSLYLRHLTLDAFARGGARLQTPLAIYDVQGNRQWVHDCNPAAARLGIEPGMPLSAALSLCAALQTHRRNEQAELAALEGIARWAGQFTPVISLQPPDGLLLEISASLKLFGGVEALRRRIAKGLNALGYGAQIAIAPTPLGARLLSLAGIEQLAADRSTLSRLLLTLPVEVLEWETTTLQALRSMGLRTLCDCLRLPRDGLARRFGAPFLHYLDRALGAVPDPQLRFEPPPRFASTLMLPAEVATTDALLFAARRLLLELVGFLHARGSGVQTLKLTLEHPDAAPTSVTIGLVRPSRDAQHLLSLLRERLERHALIAPVEAIQLSADRLLALSHQDQDLFAEDAADRQDWPQLIESLRARLGADAVHGLRLTPDHRPEQAWGYCAPGKGRNGEESPSRPLWLLEKPRSLKLVEGQPWLEGKLVLAQGPERIESGWWDGDDVMRDYFVAQGPRHERFWIFRELQKPNRWFLHGVFG